MHPTLSQRDVNDVVANRPHNAHVLDVQSPSYEPRRPNSWSTAVFVNFHDAKIVVRQHSSGMTKIKVTPPVTVDMVQPEPYEIQLNPDVPFDVLAHLLEVVK